MQLKMGRRDQPAIQNGDEGTVFRWACQSNPIPIVYTEIAGIQYRQKNLLKFHPVTL